MADPIVWPRFVFFGMSIVSIPLYILVFVCLLRLRCHSKAYCSTFYTILLQHCIADILSMVVFLFTWSLRTLPGWSDLLFEYQEYYVVAGTYNSVWYFLYIRCCGITLLSIHRYLVISARSSVITQKVQEAPVWVIVITYWTLPTLLSIVVLKDIDFQYDSTETMNLIADKDIIMRNTLMALIVVSTTCIICSLSYSAVFLFLRQNAARFSKSLRREMHLAFQVIALLSAFFVMLVFCSFQNYYARTQNAGPVYVMRSLYAIANGILSYINPYCILLLNHDFEREFISMLMLRKVEVSDVHLSTRKHSDTHTHTHSLQAVTHLTQ